MAGPPLFGEQRLLDARRMCEGISESSQPVWNRRRTRHHALDGLRVERKEVLLGKTVKGQSLFKQCTLFEGSLRLPVLQTPSSFINRLAGNRRNIYGVRLR